MLEDKLKLQIIIGIPKEVQTFNYDIKQGQIKLEYAIPVNESTAICLHVNKNEVLASCVS